MPLNTDLGEVNPFNFARYRERTSHLDDVRIVAGSKHSIVGKVDVDCHGSLLGCGVDGAVSLKPRDRARDRLDRSAANALRSAAVANRGTPTSLQNIDLEIVETNSRF
jgi:hypothetical protein